MNCIELFTKEQSHMTSCLAIQPSEYVAKNIVDVGVQMILLVDALGQSEVILVTVTRQKSSDADRFVASLTFELCNVTLLILVMNGELEP